MTPTVIANNYYMILGMTHFQSDRFILYLNSSLAMENAAIERVQRRVQQTILEDVRQQLQLHLEETRQHQDRLMQLIRKLGGTATQERGELPLAIPPQSLRNLIHSSMNAAEQELMQSVEDTIVENAEIIGYNLLIQMAEKMNIGDAIPSLRQSLHEEEKMFGWLRANAPAMFAKLWPQIASPSDDPDTMSYSTIKTSRESVAEIHQTFKCESCNGSFNSREDLRQHTIHKHEK
jgi:ferritin-like metal-binding protein YciE